jgi:nucleoside-specific outer membrane channel protein Tsx
MRKIVFTVLLSLLAGSALVAQKASSQGKAGQAMGVRYEDLHWQTIVPELGADRRRFRFCASTQ